MEVVEDLFSSFLKTAQLLEDIVAQCLGLPPNSLQKYDDDRNWDLMVALHCFQATDFDNICNSGHEDGNLITILLQDEVGGLEVRKDGGMDSCYSLRRHINVNIGDIVQALSNDKYKSATHRVVRTKGRDWYSYAFFYNLQAEKWVEPLPEFSTLERPKYKRFLYKDYQALRMRNKTHPQSRSEDVINIAHYSIPN